MPQASMQTRPKPLAVQTRHEFAQRIEDTLLMFSPTADPEALVHSRAKQALEEGFRALCVRPQHVLLAKQVLRASPVLVATVIGFPSQKHTLEAEQKTPTIGDIPCQDKLAEMDRALRDGADEFDVVMNVHFFKSLAETNIQNPEQIELIPMVQNARGRPVKLILETDLLSDMEIEQAVHMAVSAGVAMVKTSTGMLLGGKGATVPVISRLYEIGQTLPETVRPGIKASGGVQTAAQALTLLQAGADVIGSSVGLTLLNDFETTHVKK